MITQQDIILGEVCSLCMKKYSFTSAIRTGFVFQGNENITIGGGDELWLFLNRKLIIEHFLDPDDANTTMRCRRVNLAPALPNGGGKLTIETGYVISGKCQITGVLNDTDNPVELDLDVDERYHFTVFHTERYQCKSNFFMETQGVDFITETVEEPPRDYIVKIDEDLHELALVEIMQLSDTFSAGPPFKVNVIQGNEARHFDFRDNTAANRNLSVAPPPETFTYTTVEGISFVECPDPIIKIPEQNETAIQEYDITTDSVVAILDLSVDYEVATNYTIILEVIDYLKSPALTGQITLKVRLVDINDNCPIMGERNFYYYGNISLQETPILKGVATDEDATINAEMTFTRNNIVEDPPVSYNTSDDLLNVVYQQNTNLSFLLIVTDGGEPTRGTYANITVEIHNTCLVDEEFLNIFYNFVIDETTGDIYLRIPGYYQEELSCDVALGLEKAYIPDSWLNASSAYFESQANRARLNEVTLPLALDGLTGGWVPETNDQDQWIEVTFTEPMIFSQILLQGRDGLPNWVTSFYVLYKEDLNGTWAKYNDTVQTVQTVSNSSSSDNSTDGNATTAAPAPEPVDWALLNGTTNSDNVTTIYLDPNLYAQVIRINPQSWEGNISIRFELMGCSQAEKTYYWNSCQRCKTSYFCLGDGVELPCGRCEPPQADSTCGRDPLEFSFGRYEECKPCLDGWLCHEGVASPCPNATYANCTETSCPTDCIDCEPGYACRGGLRYLCEQGTYSPGLLEYCEMCPAGTYQNLTGQTECLTCESGFYTTSMQSVCSPCEAGTYSDGSDGLCQPCTDSTECPCLEIPPPCFFLNGSEPIFAICANTGSGGYKCLDCPPGFTGDGYTCEDIDECAVHNPCWEGNCRNTVPGYQCEGCPNGYEGTYEDAQGENVLERVFQDACAGNHSEVIYQQCNDIDECQTNNAGCDPNAYCHNTVGSFNCGTCKINWVGDAFYGCQPANFCASGVHKCHDHALCIYTGPGSYKCECNNGWAGDGFVCGVDPDQDGISSDGVSCTEWGCRRDNCADVANSGQEDNDNDKLGDACDPDDDEDTIYDFEDNCPMHWNIGQQDRDNDYVGDACDNCPDDPNTDQSNVDGDLIGDACETDADDDGQDDTSDNCQLVVNPDQADSDGDGIGDLCDNCIYLANAAQTDNNENDIGDDCEDGDTDGDGIYNFMDNCPDTPNGDQKDTDGDGLGDVCDHDIDADGVENDFDNCPYVLNADQTDVDGNHVGDDCDNDYDGDGVIDRYDNCPTNKFINTTDFNVYRSVNLYPGSGDASVAWVVLFDGQEIRQAVDTNATALFIGEQVLSDMDFRGTLFANSDQCFGYTGAVFGYQSSSKFYVVLWRNMHYNWYSSYEGGIRGAQLKLVNSASGPSEALAKAIWHTNTVDNEVTLLWHDPDLVGGACKTAYQWHIMHRPSRGAIRVLFKYEEDIIADSGEIYDATINGGRVGMITYAQPGAIFSKLNYECKESANYALKFDGVDDYAELQHIIDIEVNVSSTLEAWILLGAGYPMTKMPIICNEVGTYCMYIENGILHGTIGDNTVAGTTVIPDWSWTHVTMRYNAEQYILTLYINGTTSGYEGYLADVPMVYWGNETSDNLTQLFLGRQVDKYFEGTMDEVRMYSIYIPDDEIDYHWQTTGMFLEKHTRYLVQHFDFDGNPSDTILEDKSYLNLNATLYGGEFKVSQSEKARFTNTYPSNRRRRRRSLDEPEGRKLRSDILYDPEDVDRPTDVPPEEQEIIDNDRRKGEIERLARYKHRRWRDRHHKLDNLEEVFPQAFVGPFNERTTDKGGLLDVYKHGPLLSKKKGIIDVKAKHTEL